MAVRIGKPTPEFKAELGQEEHMVQRGLGCHSIAASRLFSFSIRAILHLYLQRKFHRLARTIKSLTRKQHSYWCQHR